MHPGRIAYGLRRQRPTGKNVSSSAGPEGSIYLIHSLPESDRFICEGWFREPLPYLLELLFLPVVCALLSHYSSSRLSIDAELTDVQILQNTLVQENLCFVNT